MLPNVFLIDGPLAGMDVIDQWPEGELDYLVEHEGQQYHYRLQQSGSYPIAHYVA